MPEGDVRPVAVLRMTEAAQKAALDHARAALPNEAVALLSGPSPDLATDVVSLPNLISGPGFFVPPRAQFDALMEIQARGLALVATCHSHPDGAPMLSRDDVAYLGRWDCHHVVVAIRTGDPGADRMAAWRIEGETPSAIRLTVMQDSPVP